MPKSLYLVNPVSRVSMWFGTQALFASGRTSFASMPDLASATVAALAPADFAVSLCDETLEAVDFDTPAEVVGITGKISQHAGMIRIADEFRSRGKLVVIGGPHASLYPDAVRGHCDILVRGELEAIAPELFDDLRNSRWRAEYDGGRPDFTTSPVPRWDLVDNDRYAMGIVQTSRGCPFECEFCDVIEYVGRKQRHKPVAGVLRELDVIYQKGHRFVYLADDNFTVFRSRTKELVAAIKEWNLAQRDGHVLFDTQVSIDAARDTELLRMCSEAGLVSVFIGIETPNVESLRETKKRQNIGVNLADEVQKFRDQGIYVLAGLIAGFDADTIDVFRTMFDFAAESSIPCFTANVLTAPEATPLHARLSREGRLVANYLDKDGSPAAQTTNPWTTNLIPKQMTPEELTAGMKWLCNNLYDPDNFGARLLRMCDGMGPRLDPASRHAPIMPKIVGPEALRIVQALATRGPKEEKLLSQSFARIARTPGLVNSVINALFYYAAARMMLDEGGFWDPALCGTDLARAPAGRAHVAPSAPTRLPVIS